MSSNRRDLRIKAMQILYAWEISREPIEQIVRTVGGDVAPEKEQFALLERLVYTVLDHREECDELITKLAANWEFDRIAVIDRILLRIGICELFYFPEIPPKATINEAIEIAKRYSTEKSGKFVNGILDAILSDLKKNGTLNKSGRGLVGLN